MTDSRQPTADSSPPTAHRLQKFLAPALITVMAFVIVLLVLNLMEVDHYPGAMSEPPGESAVSESRPIGLTEAATCSCVCLDCRHAASDISGRMTFQVTDRDGWYRLFWAGSTTLFFADASSFLTALENETCSDPQGGWTVTVTYPSRCAGERPVLFCYSTLPRTVKLEYTARISETPPDSIDFVSDPQGRIRIPTRVIGPGREIVRTGKLVFIEWVLSQPPEVTYQSCECPR